MFFFFTDTPPTEFYTLSLHDALPILGVGLLLAGVEPARHHHHGRLCDAGRLAQDAVKRLALERDCDALAGRREVWRGQDRKSTRLNSSHPSISYAVFCLKKKKNKRTH